MAGVGGGGSSGKEVAGEAFEILCYLQNGLKDHRSTRLWFSKVLTYSQVFSLGQEGAGGQRAGASPKPTAPL